MDELVRVPLSSASTYDGDLWVFVETTEAHMRGWAWVALDDNGNIVDRSEFEWDNMFTGFKQTGPIWWAYADGVFRRSTEALQSPSGDLFLHAKVPTSMYPHPLKS